MMKQSLHIHTVLDDGRNTMEEMVRAGIEAGLESMGFSGHSWLPFGADWTMSPEAEKQYHREIKRLRKLYPEIRIYEGLELDLYSETLRSYLSTLRLRCATLPSSDPAAPAHLPPRGRLC